MSNAIYAALTRQNGLMHELNVTANNIANSTTTGYRANRGIFAEFIVATGNNNDSLSMGGLAGHTIDQRPGGLEVTGGQLDLAIQGEGFFAVETPEGVRLTRAGHFQRSADGELVDAFGNRLLSQGGGPISLPPEATSVSIAQDGSMSANGELIDQVGVFQPTGQMLRAGNTYFEAPEGYAPIEAPNVVQFALEGSNVSPILEIARLIDIQRAYEAGQVLLEREDSRINQLLRAVRQGQ